MATLILSLAPQMRVAAAAVAAPRKYGSTDPSYLWNVMSSADKGTISVLWFFAAVIFPWMYTALQECSTSQATFGKRLLNIQVTDLEGRRISFARASGRFFGSLIP